MLFPVIKPHDKGAPDILAGMGAVFYFFLQNAAHADNTGFIPGADSDIGIQPEFECLQFKNGFTEKDIAAGCKKPFFFQIVFTQPEGLKDHNHRNGNHHKQYGKPLPVHSWQK
jgi:hypothetical protein